MSTVPPLQWTPSKEETVELLDLARAKQQRLVGAPRRVYLAGPITGLSFGGATEWREGVTGALAQRGVIGVSPLRAKDYLKNEAKLGDTYESIALSSGKGITTRDRFDCMTSDAVLFNFLGADKVSIGTCIEIGWADAFRKPGILVIEPEKNVHDHGMIREICGFRVATLDEAVAIAAAILAT